MLTPNGGAFGRNPTFKTGQYTASVIVRLGTSPNGLVND